MKTEPLPHGLDFEIDEHRKVSVFPMEDGVQFDLWTGSCRSTIRLSHEAFLLAERGYHKTLAMANAGTIQVGAKQP
jgi:hypothetical protein